MGDFFGGVGEGHAAGIWEDVPTRPPGFRERYRKQIEARQGARPADAGR